MSWKKLSDKLRRLIPCTRAPSLLESVNKMKLLTEDPQKIFSASEALHRLQALEKSARKEPNCKCELREILIMIGTIEFKRSNFKLSYDAMKTGLEMETERAPVYYKDAKDHYLLAGLAEDFSDYEVAQRHYGYSFGLAGQAAEFTEDQRLGILQKYGFTLHEAGHYSEALQANTSLLKAAGELFGQDDERLAEVMTNLAQNLHKLGRYVECERVICLKRGHFLTIALH